MKKMNPSELLRDFQQTCPELVKNMMSSHHSWEVGRPNPHHIENGVWAHTVAVLLASVFRKSNSMVQLCALLHDTGKYLAEQRVEETQRVRFFGHEGISCFLSQRYLASLNLTQEENVMAWALISYHTYIYQRMKLDTFEQDVSDKFRGNVEMLENLISLNAADATGRFADDLEDENRAFWEKAEDNLGHLVYKTQNEVYKRETQGESIVLVGPPLSGKSTWINNFQKSQPHGYKVVSRDDVIMRLGKGKNYTDAYHSVSQDEVNAEYDFLAKEAKKSKQNVIFDLTHMTEKSRRKSLDGLDKNMKKTAVVFLASFETLMARNEKRKKEEGKYIPERILCRMMAEFNFPLIGDSGFDEIQYVIVPETNPIARKDGN